ncbi:flagellar export protein FliJ [Paenibacillus darwinianus]|uniref:Flagellar FliJ protein n=1 Tax=Paenibacillus darwinianus TaxID=1380763 RepID=A0A9W5S3H7_9BACL|nr:flagellar export protein FliJ [Paenibacillus darwinianus]EXX91329.1 flagellar export protein FliJ [Paenibacillus darwinianus]EXX92292.1 flagellar export protein FliJ [Paenibacillus darwinianus]EXX92829.1 flagellar export protein FliJ [Paenibacillus darwinianus]
MSKYRYPLQRIVDLKTSEKTQAEWMLSAAIGKLHEEERKLEQLASELAGCQERLHAAASEGIPLAELQLIQHYISYLESRIDCKKQDVRCAQTEVEHEQGRLSLKMMDEKIWLKTKEKALDAFLQDMRLKEQNELDEMATVRYMLPAR